MSTSIGTATDGRAGSSRPTTLVVDIGGTGLKASVLDADGAMMTDRVRVPTRYPCPPDRLVEQLEQLVATLPACDRASVGFPGVVRGGVILSAPHFVTKLGPGSAVEPELTKAWRGFDLGATLTRAFACPVRIVNDADLQGLDVITGNGVEVVITLGTGLGVAAAERGRLSVHLELAHHPFRKGKTYNEYVGDAARKAIGHRRWNKRVHRVIAALDALFFFDHLYVGGGNACHLKGGLGPKMSIIDPNAALLGGIAVWASDSTPGPGAAPAAR